LAGILRAGVKLEERHTELPVPVVHDASSTNLSQSCGFQSIIDIADAAEANSVGL